MTMTMRNDSTATWHIAGVPILFSSWEQARAYQDARPHLAGLTVTPKVYNWSNARCDAPVSSLFVDWLIAEVALAADHYAVCAEDLDPFRGRANLRAAKCGLAWTDEMQDISEGCDHF